MKKYSSIPVEIRNKVKERVEEAGNEYNEKKIAEFYEAENTILGSGNDGFSYSNTIEGFTFWHNVINSGKHDEFFKKYPKKIKSVDSEDFIEGQSYPDEKKGTVYKVKATGELVTLKHNDESINPCFWNNDKSDYNYISWIKLERVEQPIIHTLAPIPIKEVVCRMERIIGNEYKVIRTTEPKYYEVGDVVRFIYDDKSESPRFLNTRTNREVYIPWIYLVLNNLNLNTIKDGSNKESNIAGEFVLHGISPTITARPTPGRVVIQSSRSKILLGS